MPKNTTQCSQPGIINRLLKPETSELTMKPPSLTSSEYTINQITLNFLLFLTYLLGDTYIDDIINTFLASLWFKTNRFLVICICSVIIHRRGENVVKTSATLPFSSYHIVTASAIYYWTDIWQHWPFVDYNNYNICSNQQKVWKNVKCSH